MCYYIYRQNIIHGEVVAKSRKIKLHNITAHNTYKCLDIHLSISNGIIPAKMYNKRCNWDFEIVYFLFLVEIILWTFA